MIRTKKKKTHIYLLVLLLLLGIGFAALTATLKINGTAGIKSNQWDIHWENVQVNNESTVTTEEPAITENRTKVTYEVNLELPGDFYEFTVDAKNDGTIDGMITNISNKVYENNVEVNPTYLESTITYADGATIENNHLLAAGKKETYKVKVQYKQGLAADELPTSSKTYNFRFTVTYMQADESATTTCGNTVSFAEDSWETIACNVRKGNVSKSEKSCRFICARNTCFCVECVIGNFNGDDSIKRKVRNFDTETERSRRERDSF